MILAQNQYNSTLTLANFAVSGSIWTAATTVDIVSSIRIPQTTAWRTLTLPTPTANMDWLVMYIHNSWTVPFVMHWKSIASNNYATFMRTNSWRRSDNNKLAPFATAPVATLTIATLLAWSLTGTYVDATDRTITYRWFVWLTIPNVAWWKLFNHPNVAWYTSKISKIGTYRQSGTPTWTPPAPFMWCEAHWWYSWWTATYIWANWATWTYRTYLSIDIIYTLT